MKSKIILSLILSLSISCVFSQQPSKIPHLEIPAVTKKDVIIRKYRELKTHMTEILGEEDSDNLFLPVDEFKIYLPKYISDFEYYFKNETKYNRFFKILLKFQKVLILKMNNLMKQLYLFLNI